MKYTIGIDIGGTSMKIGLLDEALHLCAEGVVSTHRHRTWQEVVYDLIDGVRRVLEQAKVDREVLLAIGVGCPGVANQQTGLIEQSCNLQWKDVPLAQSLREAFGVPIYLENDANAAAWGEFVAGCGKGVDSLVAVTLGTGIGGGIIADHKIWHGFNFAAGEIGHMVIELDGEPCACGRHGCFERYASATALIQQTKKAMAQHPESKLCQVAQGLDQVNGKTVFAAAEKGDPTAQAVLDRYVQYLAVGITNLINLFQPARLCIGGGIGEAGEVLLTPLRKLVAKQVYQNDPSRRTEIVAATLGNHAGILGAGCLHRIKG